MFGRGLLKEHLCKNMSKYLHNNKGLLSLFPIQVNGNFKLSWQQIKIGNLYNSLCLVKDYSTNIYEKVLSKYLQWDNNKRPTFNFLIISQWKICHSNKSTWAMAIKTIIFIEANVLNIPAKFQLLPPYGFWGDDFLICFRKFSLSVAMKTNQIRQFGQNSYAS